VREHERAVLVVEMLVEGSPGAARESTLASVALRHELVGLRIRLDQTTKGRRMAALSFR
jgi:hypothetical protein